MTLTKTQAAAAVIICFIAGFWAKSILHDCPEPKTITQTKVEYKDRIQTVIKYVPKDTSGADADIDIEAQPQKLTVSVNGQQAEITKSDDERFIFDKNKIQFEQQATAHLDINIPVKDETRRWGIGAGLNADGPEWIITGPTGNKYMDFYASGDQDKTSGGVIIRF